MISNSVDHSPHMQIEHHAEMPRDDLADAALHFTLLRQVGEVGCTLVNYESPSNVPYDEINAAVKEWLYQYCLKTHVSGMSRLLCAHNVNFDKFVILQWIDTKTMYPKFNTISMLENGSIYGMGYGWCRLMHPRATGKSLWPHAGGLCVKIEFEFDGKDLNTTITKIQDGMSIRPWP